MRWLSMLLGLGYGTWLGGLCWFVVALRTPCADPEAFTDAIVVPTGGSQRIEHGLLLLASGHARKLFISGVHVGVDRQAIVGQVPIAAAKVECCVVLGHAAENTEGNAEETAAWLDAEDLHSVRLVTANYHMWRALLEFRRALPAEDTILADPVIPETASPLDLPTRWSSAKLILVQYTKYLRALFRPAAVFLLAPLHHTAA